MFKVLSQEELLIKYLIEQINKEENLEKDGYSNNIDFGLSELVRFYIRKIAQDTEYIYEQEVNLLSQSMRMTEYKLKEKLGNTRRFNFNKYFRNIEPKLRYVAQEVKELRLNLIRSQREERVAIRRRVSESSRIPIEITELGLSGFIDGLLAKAFLNDSEGYNINLENLGYPVEGEWFAFEVMIEDSVFTIDDDGTIFVSVENLPQRLVLRAKEMLQVIANQLYRS